MRSKEELGKLDKAMYVVNKEAKMYRDASKMMKKFLFHQSEWNPNEIEGHVKEFISRSELEEVFNCDFSFTDDTVSSHDKLSHFIKTGIKDLNEMLENAKLEYNSDKENYEDDPENYNIDEIEEQYRNECEYYDEKLKGYENAEKILERGYSFLKEAKSKKEYLYDLKGCIISHLNLDVNNWYAKEGDLYNWYPLYRIENHTFHRLIDRDYAEEKYGIKEADISSKPLPDEITSQSHATEEYPSADEAIRILQEELGLEPKPLSEASKLGQRLPSEILSIELPPVGHPSYDMGNDVESYEEMGEYPDYDDDENYDNEDYDTDYYW